MNNSTAVGKSPLAAAKKRGQSKHTRRESKRFKWCYLFIFPQLILFAVFTIYPIVMSYVYSFYEYDGFGPLKDFIGFENFTMLVNDPLFWNAFKHSFIFMLGMVLVQVPLALLLAILLNAAWLKGKSFYRTIFFLPVITTTAVVGLVMRFIFGAYKGALNEALINLHLLDHPIDWVGSSDTALVVVMVVGIWKTLGMKMIYWLAGLQSLPKELYEAAKVDGASSIQTLRKITIPLLLPIGSVIILLAAVNALHMFDLVKSMTEGGPAYATDMVDVYVYRNAFAPESGQARVGFAAAAGVFYGVAVLVVSLVFGLLIKKTGGKTTSH
ncbi:sugar ABC transporter permease [Paenibacillus sp. HB172176]|uniref:carbohydrate ABC transporter permease n=1 Tax=Paenibacillus sp. HB172176 TaxID=2493690 RepID=UPI001F0DDBC5|nr:sugar ABC transporter permease [Paenibacillus sp. HB172176]